MYYVGRTTKETGSLLVIFLAIYCGLVTVSMIQLPHRFFNLRYRLFIDSANGTETKSIVANNLLLPDEKNCSRFASIVHNDGMGLGHKLTEVIFGMKFAEETNSVYVYNFDTFELRGDHGSYEWLAKFLPLQTTEFTTAELYRKGGIGGRKKVEAAGEQPPDKRPNKKKKNRTSFQVIRGNWYTVVERSKRQRCNVEFYTNMDRCCKNSTCTICFKDLSRSGVLEDMKGRMRKAFSLSTYIPSQQLADTLGQNRTSLVSIVWHIRVGDIILNANKDYFWNISKQIAASFGKNTKVPSPHVFFLGEKLEEKMLKHFPFLPDICNQFFNGSCSFPNMTVDESFYSMIKSDVLVTSGSSFASIAAMLRTSGITLAAVPKSGKKYVGIYDVSENLHIDEAGNIDKIGELTQFLESHTVNTDHLQNNAPPVDH